MPQKDPATKSRKKRTAWVHILMYPEERLAWQSLAKNEGLSLADFIRKRVGQPVLHSTRPRQKPRPASRVDPELIRQVARLGNNLNQIARGVNGRSLTGLEILVRIAVIERELKKVVDGPH